MLEINALMGKLEIESEKDGLKFNMDITSAQPDTQKPSPLPPGLERVRYGKWC